ncbi:13599_t:CDS:2, partial [Entrophospora sp. SA101]
LNMDEDINNEPDLEINLQSEDSDMDAANILNIDGEIDRSLKEKISVSPKMHHQIGKIVNSNHFVTAGEIKARLEETHTNFEATEQTIRNELSRLGYVATLPRRVPLLTEQAKQNRLVWAQSHSRYNWRKVVFSDETTLQMFRNTCLAWSHSDKPIPPMVKHPFKLHMWGAICAHGKVGMCTVKAMVAQKQNVSQEAFIALAREEWNNIPDDVVLRCVT